MSKSGSSDTGFIFSKKTSILNQLPGQSVRNPTLLGLIGSLVWCVIYLFYFINDTFAEPLNSYAILVTTDIGNVLSALLLFIFALKISQRLDSNILLPITIGFGLRILGRILEWLGYFLIEQGIGTDNLHSILFICSDVVSFVGVFAYAGMMLFFFFNEQKKSFKAICLISAIFAFFYSVNYIFLFLMDISVISVVYIQITRLISVLSAIFFIVYFSFLLRDINKQNKHATNQLNM